MIEASTDFFTGLELLGSRIQIDEDHPKMLDFLSESFKYRKVSVLYRNRSTKEVLTAYDFVTIHCRGAFKFRGVESALVDVLGFDYDLRGYNDARFAIVKMSDNQPDMLSISWHQLHEVANALGWELAKDEMDARADKLEREERKVKEVAKRKKTAWWSQQSETERWFSLMAV